MITEHCPKCGNRMLRDYIQRPGPSSKSRPYMKKGWWCPRCDYGHSEPGAVKEIAGFMGLESKTTRIRLHKPSLDNLKPVSPRKARNPRKKP